MEYSVHTQALVNVTISSSLTSFVSERRFQKNVNILELKGKLELITGSSRGSMVIELYNKDDKRIAVLSENDALLGSYPIEDGMRLHVIDIDPGKNIGEFEDTSKVEKYEISDDAYSKRTDSVRAFKLRNNMGEFKKVNPEELEKLNKEKELKKELEKKTAEDIMIGSRCEVNNPKNPPTKRGTVMFVGETDFKPGYWIGIKYDEPFGKNDGSFNGKRYFECPQNYGGFVKPQYVLTGDFPEEDIDFDEEI